MSASLDQFAEDYARVERAIAFIERNRLDQPCLDEVALAMGLSPSHAQRVFTRWVGISPKRFLGLLTVEHAKSLLRDASSVLETTFEVGLSGPSRLHDLFVTFEAMTPGEYKALGSGLVLRWGVHPTPFGEAMIAVTDRGVARLAFLAGERLEELVEATRQAWPLSRLVRDQAATAPWMARCFPEVPTDEPLPLLVKGTPFQIQVWRALTRIPDATTVSYGGLASAIGRPGAARAIGTACGDNQLPYLIPCHRVVRDSGALGDYRWGPARKHAMLAWETVRQQMRRHAALLEIA
jgi:AraC family transcriptional regulator of adaptative response/methylated-DNA-[protein]-cysteine methyltransferase